MTREEKDECSHKLQYIVNRANWGTIDRDENGLPLGIRYASDVAEAIEKDNTTTIAVEIDESKIKQVMLNQIKYDIAKIEENAVKEFVEWYKERLEHIQEHEKELLDDDVKHEYSYLVEYRKGTTDMLDRLLLHIDSNLEKFLEK